MCTLWLGTKDTCIKVNTMAAISQITSRQELSVLMCAVQRLPASDVLDCSQEYCDTAAHGVLCSASLVLSNIVQDLHEMNNRTNVSPKLQ